MNILASIKITTLLLTFAIISVVNTGFAAPLSIASEASVALEVSTENNYVALTWNIDENIEGQVFVQRAGMDMQFETISQSEEVKNGQFKDKQPKSGMSFYRLAVQQVGGTVIYHNTITVTR